MIWIKFHKKNKFRTFGVFLGFFKVYNQGFFEAILHAALVLRQGLKKFLCFLLQSGKKIGTGGGIFFKFYFIFIFLKFRCFIGELLMLCFIVHMLGLVFTSSYYVFY